MKHIFLTILIVNILLTATQMVLSTYRSSGGVALASIREQADILRRENNQLSASIAQKSSLAVIEQTASRLGLSPISTVAFPPLTVAQAVSTSRP